MDRVKKEFSYIAQSHNETPAVVLADANFPSAALAKKLIRLDGANIPNVAKAILSVLPLDSFVDYPVERMEIDGNPDEINDVHQDLIDVLKNSAGDKWKVGSIERFKFYEEAKQAYMIVSTTDARAFGCFIITKGVIKPDGSVW